MPLVSKVLERCVYNRVIDHIAPRLHKLQFGILKGKSTTAKLLQILHNIGEKLDKRVQVDTIYLDFAKAFDSANHATNYCSRRSTDSASAVLCCLGSKTKELKNQEDDFVDDDRK